MLHERLFLGISMGSDTASCSSESFWISRKLNTTSGRRRAVLVSVILIVPMRLELSLLQKHLLPCGITNIMNWTRVSLTKETCVNSSTARPVSIFIMITVVFLDSWTEWMADSSPVSPFGSNSLVLTLDLLQPVVQCRYSQHLHCNDHKLF